EPVGAAAGDGPPPPPPPPGDPVPPKRPSIDQLIGQIEGIAKDVAGKVDWQGIAGQVREGVGKGVEAVRKAAEEAKLAENLGRFFGNRETKTVELPLQVPEGKTLRIEASVADLTLHGGREVGSFTSTAGFRGANVEEAKRRAALYSPVIEETSDAIIVRLQDSPESAVDAVFHLPDGLAIEVHNTSGRLKLRQLNARLKASGATAYLDAKDVKGDLDVEFHSGECTIQEAELGRLRLETKSADVTLVRVRAEATIRSSSGDISGSDCTFASGRFETASGDVALVLAAFPSGDLTASVVSGDASISVPAGGNAQVELSTLQGEAHCSFELEDKVEGQGRLSGRLGSGGSRLQISTVSGSVRLDQADAAAH
ncbi:MAG: DUF4097 domain-containing protein, partial [Fimbriimonadaceae bacterium]|nr:DUF4097 domain-containing protein [Fimbriimonadaceae bacterium]